jgi:predicted dehydrogenase
MKKLKIAFLGGGINSAVGQVHKIAIEMDKKFELVAGCFSKSKKINLQTAKVYDINRCYKTLEELIKYEKNNIDAISILTPIPNHKNEIIKCLDNNIKVICEKAIALSVKEALEIKKHLNKFNGFLAVIYNYTGYPMLRELKHMIKKNKLGKIHQIHIEMPQESFIKLNKNKKPQKWRLKDYTLPTIYLDLASHIHNIIYFLTEEKPLEVVAINNSFGNFNVIDNTAAIINYTNNIISNIWFSKSAIGHRNGLKIRIYGEKGSAIWYQMEPENLYFYDNYGNRFIIDRESPDALISKKKRYNRFKAGHPIGFIEAFANYYNDIYNSILHNQLNKYVFGIDEAIEGLKLLTAMNKSSKNKKWENIQ